jgi:hypothetical protein
MKYELTTGTWQDDTGCPISIILVTTSDAAWAFKSLCLAFESYVRIQKLNSRQSKITYKKLAVKINQVDSRHGDCHGEYPPW